MKVLFVCTGNTCRSPMAQAIFTHKAKEQKLNMGADSAALSLTYGERVNPKAEEALRKLGITGFSHLSQPVTPQLLEESDFIVTMTWQQRAALAAVADDGKLAAFCEFTAGGDISDPYGRDQAAYDKCAADISAGIDCLIPYLKGRFGGEL